MKKVRITVKDGTASGLEYAVLGEDKASMCLERSGYMYLFNKIKNKLYTVEWNDYKTIKHKVLSIEVVEQQNEIKCNG